MNSARQYAADVVMTPAAAKLHSPESVLAPARDGPVELTIFIPATTKSLLSSKRSRPFALRSPKRAAPSTSSS